jgi:inosose dehydratase
MNPVGNAPISYGAFELTVGIYPDVPDGAGILDRVKDAGYVGIDLGPVGFLGVGSELADNLESRGLGLTGGYLEMPFHDPAAMPDSQAELAELLDVFDAASPVNARLGLPAPKPTIAVVSQPHRRARPGQGEFDRSLDYSEAEWQVFAVQAEQAAAACRARGYQPVFHNETGTNVEAPSELDRVLDLTSFDLCLDTGHLLACGGDPEAFLRKWGERLGQLHIKSARRERMRALVDSGESVDAIWAQRVFCRLGDGDLDVAAICRAVEDVRYAGWIVVEQDIFPDEHSLADAESDQRANRELLRNLGY